jgi:thioredoxin reductase (NADPH)
VFDVVVIGEGMAGLSAANAAATAGTAVATFEAGLFGGLVTNVNELDPSPDSSAHNGADLAATLSQANADLGVVSIQGRIDAVVATGTGFLLQTSEGDHRARRVVVASGARLRRLDIPGERELEGRGVSSCADCDAPFFSGEEVVVVGSGDSALQEALVLSGFCRRVHIVHHGMGFTGRADLARRVTALANIVAIPDAELESIEGTDAVERVIIRRGTDRERQELTCRGVFAYTGLVPNTEFLPESMRRDAAGRLLTDTSLQTTVRGVFAAGIVRSGCGGTLTDAMDDGAAAGRAAAGSLER